MPSGIQQTTQLKGTETIVIDPGSPINTFIFTQLMGAWGQASNGLTASTTHTIAGGTALVLGWNFVATVANSGDAVTLPAMTPGMYTIVFNAGANPCAVFPAASGVAIDGGSAGASVTLTNAKRCIYYCNATNTITSAQLGVASA